jgi:glycerol-3-phosphate cytidylyltransferase
MIKGFTCSAFDLLHTGHIAMLEEAKQQCDYLIVGLQTNPTLDRPKKNKPIQSTFERYIQLKGCKYVDEIIPYDTEEDLLNLLQIVQPDLRILGIEYINKNYTGKDLPIKTYFNTRSHNYSSSSLRNRLK